jgi:small-conductance mechanosensitive channel
MSRSGWVRGLASAGWLLAGLLMPMLPVAAQPGATAAAAQPAPAEPRWLPVLPGDIPARAEADVQFIAEARQRVRAAGDNVRFESQLAQRAADVQRLADRSGGAALDTLAVNRLETLLRHWKLFDREITRLRGDLSRATDALSEDAAELAGRRIVWQATRAQAADSAPALLQRADELVLLAAEAEAALATPLAGMIELGRQGAALSAQVQAAMTNVREQLDDHDRRLLVIDTPPLWTELTNLERIGPVQTGLRRALVIEQALAHDHDAANAMLLPVLAALAALLLPLMFWLKRLARKMVAEGQASEASMVSLSQPWAGWLVLVALAAIVYDQQGPLMRQQVVMLLAWVPVLVLVRRRLLEVVGPWAYFSALFYLLNLAVSLFTASPPVYRGTLMLLNLLMLGTLAWLALGRRTGSGAGHEPGNHSADEPRKEPGAAAGEGVASAGAASRARGVDGMARWVLWAAALALVVSIGANLVGNVSLAGTLTGAVLDTSYLALAIHVGATVVEALFKVLLARPGVARRLGPRAKAMAPTVARIWRLLLIGAWLVFTLQAFRIYRPLNEGLRALLSFEIHVGVMRFTPGNLVSLVVATWAAFWIARSIRSLLAEDILPGLALTHGVSSSVSTLSYYAALSIGLFAAMAAAGFQVGELALIFGALSVGIGFGLQDVVRNFVAGVILMFERPVQPGDVVELAGMPATVTEIGLRATTMTTADGAAVIVPNGLLLADKIVNWTLSGNSRRIHVNISTGYNVTPQQTIELLEKVARSQPGVAFLPPPVALLSGLMPGAMEFNLRAWTRPEADWIRVRSELTVKVRAALDEAGIEVPMPQREFKLRGLAPEVAAAMAAPAPSPAPSPPAGPTPRGLP